jgi:hypothetical protein
MDVKYDSMTFHQINNQMTLVQAYIELLDRKMGTLDTNDPTQLDHWNELKKSCTAAIALFKQYRNE